MVDYEKQVDSDKYFSDSYITPRRWNTYGEIILLVLKSKPRKILEIGPGNNIVKNILNNFDFIVKTLDFDPKIEPDYTMSVASDQLLSLKNEEFDLIIASEVLEHVEYEDFKKALKNLRKICQGKLVLTLPYTSKLSKTVNIKIGRKTRYQKRIFFKREDHKFNGQHYWEIGEKGYSLKRLERILLNLAGLLKNNISMDIIITIIFLF